MRVVQRSEAGRILLLSVQDVKQHSAKVPLKPTARVHAEGHSECAEASIKLTRVETANGNDMATYLEDTLFS